ncbi:MAG: DUF547 domain-containing protein [Betaproteobacteria bacterium]|nr:DUF547 domain-containing protein [Betaproteobacteria bacterium]
MIRYLLAVFMLWGGSALAAFDHTHAQWDALLKQNVVLIRNGNGSEVKYESFKRERAALKSYLALLSAVPQDEFNGWSKPQQLAFLINVYNSYTVELILTRYPDIESIQDFGKFINNPWKKKFFSLFGKPRSLDEIEHGMIRAEGVYDDPRIHMAVNCASIGCPALRHEAYAATRLDEQLEDSLKRFLSDHSRNRFSRGTLEVSKIFDWYEKDFAKGFRSAKSLNAFLAPYANVLSDKPEDQQRIREGKVPIRFLDYDWALNDRKVAQ